MRIAYLHYLYGEDTALNHVRQFADAARNLGHRVDVHAMNLAPDAPADPTGGAPHQVRDALKRRLGRYLHEPKELWWNLRYVRRERATLRAESPDVLLVRDHLFTASCVPVARKLHLPLVLEVNAPAEESRLYLDEYAHVPWLPERLERWKLQRADAVTTVSSSLKDYLVQRYGIAPSKIAVVPNGADLDLFRTDMRPEPGVVRKDPGSVLIGFVGSFQKWHGADLLLRLIRRVAALRPAARFLLVGDGPSAPALRSSTRNLGERVTFTGSVPHAAIPPLVASLDIGVLPEADFYRCPLKVIEWMAAGRAIIAPAYAPLGDLIEDGVHGLLFPPGDEDALVQAVLRLADAPRLRQTLGSAAAARAHGSLSWADNARRVLAACESAIERHRNTPLGASPEGAEVRSCAAL